MHAEVIAIGDEITSGQALDTNSRWLSQRLGEAGVDVLFHTSVGDQLEACIDVFQTALRRAEVVITTGGLGPTDDDLTARPSPWPPDVNSSSTQPLSSISARFSLDGGARCPNATSGRPTFPPVPR